ncbi:Body wall muscle protein HR-29, partial [Trichinella pseudospiralis]
LSLLFFAVEMASSRFAGQLLRTVKNPAVWQRNCKMSLWRPGWWDGPLTDFSRTVDREMRRFEREMNHFFNYFPRPFFNAQDYYEPFICEENGMKKFKLRFDVSRFKPEEINVKTSGNKLYFEAKQHSKQDDVESKYEYKREFTLPEGVKAETVQCKYSTDGQLVIEAPYDPPPAVEGKSKEIPVIHE